MIIHVAQMCLCNLEHLIKPFQHTSRRKKGLTLGPRKEKFRQRNWGSNPGLLALRTSALTTELSRHQSGSALSCFLEHLFKTTHIFEQTSQNTTSLTHTHTNTLFKIFFLPLFYFFSFRVLSYFLFLFLVISSLLFSSVHVINLVLVVSSVSLDT